QPAALQRRRQRLPIHYRRQHAQVVGGDALHAARGGWLAAPDVATADDHAHLDTTGDDGGYLAGDRLHGAEVDAVGRRTLEGLPTQLEEDPPVAELAIQCAIDRPTRNGRSA